MDTELDSVTDIQQDSGIDTVIELDSDQATSTTTDSANNTETDSESDNCLEGNFTIENTLDLIQIQPFGCITGDLIITQSSITNLSLPNLKWIGGSLGIMSNPSLY